MKFSIILLLPILVFASESTLTPTEHFSIHSYNNRPLVKSAKKRNMHKLHKINEEQAKKIVKDETHEEVLSLNLTHKGDYLIYKARTEHYRLIINALDGTIVKKE